MRNSQLMTNPFAKRPTSSLKKTLSSLLFSLMLAFVFMGLLLYCSGERAGVVFLDTITQGFFVGEQWSHTLAKAIPIVFVGLSVSMAWGSGYYSMSNQGELLVGLLTTGLILGLDWSIAPSIVVGMALLGGALAGMCLSLTTAWISHYFSTSLLMTTLMCNYIVLEIGHYISNLYQNMEQELLFFGESTLKPMLPLEWSVLFVLLVTISIFYLKSHHIYGYHMKIRGVNYKFAHFGGVPEEKTLYGTLALSGAIAGLGGAMVVVIGSMNESYQFFLDLSFSLQGLTTGLMCNYHPVGVLISGVFFGGLSVGGDYVTAQHGISSSMIPIIQGIVALVVTTDLFSSFDEKKGGKS